MDKATAEKHARDEQLVLVECVHTSSGYKGVASSAVLNFSRYQVSGQSNTLMAHEPKQSKSGIDRYSIPLWPGGGNGS